jgi:hypothetical protein
MTTLIPIGAALILVVGFAEIGVPAQEAVLAVVLFSAALPFNLLRFAALLGHLGLVAFFLLGGGPSAFEKLGVIGAHGFLFWTARQRKPY